MLQVVLSENFYSDEERQEIRVYQVVSTIEKEMPFRLRLEKQESVL